MKKIFTLFAVFALSMAAMAQNKASLIVTGRDTDKNILSFHMTNNFEVHGVGFTFKLPAGVTIALNDDEEEIIKKNNTRAKGSDYTFDVKNPSEGVYVISLSGGTKAITGTEGEIVYVKLDGDLKGVCEVYNINFSDGGDGVDPKTIKSYYMNDNEDYRIYAELKADAINGIKADETKSGVIYNMAGQRVSKATKGIYVVDGKKVAVSK